MPDSPTQYPDEYSSEKIRSEQNGFERPASIGPEDGKTNKFIRHLIKILFKIVIGILAVLALRYGSEYVYSKFRATGLAPEMPYAKEYNAKDDSVDVYLIPFDGFNEATASQIANIMSQELKINVKTSLSVPLDQAAFNVERKQYIESSLYAPIYQVIPGLKNKTDKTAYIGLLNADMYPREGDFNYVFSAHWENRISVVATGRLIPFEVFSKDRAQRIYGQRLLKLVKRTIGQQYFGLARSSSKSSIMYSPLTGPDDLDQMGYEY